MLITSTVEICIQQLGRVEETERQGAQMSEIKNVG